jgi:hypothetical protein
VTVPDPAHVVIKFSEPVVLSSDPMQDFVITEEADIMNSLNIKNVRLEADSSVVTLTTDPQKPVNYNLIVPGIKDKAGNLISVESNATVFKGWDSGLMPMLTQETQAMTQQTQVQAKAPEDATKFAASLIGNAIVRLVWAASADTANNLANYILYKGTDGKSYGPGVLIDPETLKYDVNELVPGLKYFFKLTARSTTGNESKGVITTFVLPSTGPELGLLLFGSLGLGKFFSGKKKGGKKGGCGGSK